ncbi:leucine-rich repeat domain-containing protein [Thiofilum flexile]|uniref:leucine-rich repeat domain-containing protein n=1 Tax=Thiofilum flexile TaxID=125627 RepID=UPI00035FAC1C|nr:leucine-rich repeat domain-containing protein [Thiofilum flexile]
MPTPLEIALERIEACRQTKAPRLDLRNLLLDEIPPSVFELVWLEELDLSTQPGKFDGLHGLIKTIPPEIAQLTKLLRLNVERQSLSDLSPLQSLHQLQSLDCSWNQITDLSPLHSLLQLQSLGCWNNQITDLSPLHSLLQLQKLGCWNNQITDLSPLHSLHQLQSLNCGDNKITDLSPLQSLQQLQSLACGGNKITDLSPLQSLQQLQSLSCRRNPENIWKQITDLSPLQSLLQLKWLDCSGNQITDLSPLHSLQQLQSLHCRSNKITDLSPLHSLLQLKWLDCRDNQITDFSPFVETLLSRQFEHLGLANNPIASIPSVLLGDIYDDCYESLRHYYLALKQGFEWRRQLKIQFIGNGRVGKTSLAYALKHQKAAPPHMESTHGITIETCCLSSESNEPITWQLWDFGGQEIYHATHRLFLSDDCLYLLVWAEETEAQPTEINHPVSYWLEAIHDLAPNSPVILVKNQIDRSDKHPSADPADFSATMLGAKQIRQAAKTSAIQYKNIKSLRVMIEEVVEELKGRVCLQLPRSWLAVEEAINQYKLTHKTLSFDHFTTLCQQHQIDYAEWFADYLHKTGVMFYRKGAFQDQIILDQNWIIEAVYKVFDSKAPYRKRLIKKGGRFSGFESQLIWQNTDETEREIYINFMRDCHICYEANRYWNIPFAEREYIIPAFLPEKNPTEKLWGNISTDWHYKVHYPFLHRSIIERLIIRLGETYKDNARPWRDGIYCETEWGQVSLVCHIPDKTQSNQGYLQFSLRGTHQEGLLYALRQLVNEISPHHRYAESLQRGQEEAQDLPEFKKEESFTSRLDKPVEKPAVQVFISYSKEDKEHRLELEKRLKNISRQFKVKAWGDEQLLAGGLTDKDIKAELSKADLILLLISSDFFDNDDCYDIELPLALKRYQAKKAIVIPIIVRNTPNWQEQAAGDFKLGQITPLPKDGLPLKQWPDKDDFWADVHTGITARIKHLLAEG